MFLKRVGLPLPKNGPILDFIDSVQLKILFQQVVSQKNTPLLNLPKG
jgi:hypothetical protein